LAFKLLDFSIFKQEIVSSGMTAWNHRTNDIFGSREKQNKENKTKKISIPLHVQNVLKVISARHAPCTVWSLQFSFFFHPTYDSDYANTTYDITRPKQMVVYIS